MPINTSARPTPSERRPRTIDSDTTELTARKANAASAKYSAGPNIVAIETSSGIAKTVTSVARIPPKKAPIAAVARALPARPLRAIRLPSNDEAIADELPGVLSRMPAVESPKRPPK
jgi:hypothetical protein